MREKIALSYTSTQIRDAAYEVLSHLTDYEYEHAEKVLWAFYQQLEKEGAN
jgi:hypothetical protein